MLVHFICRGNVFRSLIAETYLKSLKLPDVRVMSSGTKADYYREENVPLFDKHVLLLKSHGLGVYIKERPEQLDQSRLQDNDVVILLNDIALSEAKDIVTLPINTQTWDITDIGEGSRTNPFENGRIVEEVVYDEITAEVDKLVLSLNL